jgi:C4-dicarboxylate-specific signal transduction histidine kinase
VLRENTWGCLLAGRLIIVDDEPVILDLFRAVFEGEPYEVLSFSTGMEAMAEMRARGVDVLLTDKNLPDIGGLDLLRVAHEVQPDSEGIIITGYASLETALEAIQLGAFDYIIKPPRDVFEVRRKVRQAFIKVAMVRENQRLLEQLKAQNEVLELALEEMKELQSELIHSEKLAGIGVLAAGIAHEVCSPLFGVLGLAEAIRAEEDMAVASNHAGEIEKYATQIKNIVHELSVYARDTGREEPQEVNVGEVVGDAALLVARSMTIPIEAIQVEEEPGVATVSARKGELQQVFVNLIKNAVQAVQHQYGRMGTAGEGRVCVHVRTHLRHVRVDVVDNGPGVEDEKKRAVFDPFFTTKDPGQGTGLGLNIVYRILTRYRGSIQVHDSEGGGATFVVKIPVRSASSQGLG